MNQLSSPTGITREKFLSNSKPMQMFEDGALSLPNLERAESYFLRDNENLKNLSLPNLESPRKCFLCNNKNLKNLSFIKNHGTPKGAGVISY